MNPLRYLRALLLPGLLLAAVPALASTAGDHPPELNMCPILLAIVVILIAAKLGADVAVRVGQPPVLGELVFGLVVGNLGLIGFHTLDYVGSHVVVTALAELGVILLLFEVGLESNFKDMTKVGVSSLLVAIVGIVAPFFLGFLVAKQFLSQHSVYVHIFIGATLCATSVGITARVLKDLGKLNRIESKIILGAAVIDDVMGLVVLAIVQGIISAASGSGSMTPGGITWIVVKAVGFLALAVMIGHYLSPKVFRFASRLKAPDLMLAVALGMCFLFAYLAGRIGLAPIVGAFAAGLVLDEVHYRDFTRRGEHGLEALLRPITSFLVPIFFVLMGIHVDLTAFADMPTVAFAAALTLVAILGKQVCSFGAFGKGVDKILVGFGMIPRGEVGLIVAAIGAGLTLRGERIVDSMTFSAVVIMVMITTFVTPPLLRWRTGRKAVKGMGDGG